jgi:hypothetical protein
MNTEIEGKLFKILPVQTGDGKFGKWVKQEFIIETFGEYPKKVCFSAWGDKSDDLKNLIEGDKITISFNPESREYNGKWFTDLRIWKITKGEAGSAKSSFNAPPPFNENDIPPEDEEDLPF